MGRVSQHVGVVNVRGPTAALHCFLIKFVLCLSRSLPHPLSLLPRCVGAWPTSRPQAPGAVGPPRSTGSPPRPSPAAPPRGHGRAQGVGLRAKTTPRGVVLTTVVLARRARGSAVLVQRQQGLGFRVQGLGLRIALMCSATVKRPERPCGSRGCGGAPEAGRGCTARRSPVENAVPLRGRGTGQTPY